MKKNSKILLGALALIITVAGGYYAMSQPPSIEYLKEHPEEFRFEDYTSEQSLQHSLTQLFPVGTDRAQVEDILIDHANMQAGHNEGKNENYFISYFYLNQELPSFIASRFFGAGLKQAQFQYNSSDKVVSIKSQIIDGKTPPQFFVGNVIKKGEKL